MKRLIGMLVCLTLLFVSAQVAFFFIHYHVGGIVDSLTHSSVMAGLFHPSVLLPVLGFIFIQLLAYGLVVAWVWFVAASFTLYYQWTDTKGYVFGLIFWLLSLIALFLLNTYYYPNSFFALPFDVLILLVICLVPLLLATLLAFWCCYQNKRYRGVAVLLMMFVLIAMAPGRMESIASASRYSQPNIILIGLDSLRPDHIGYFGNAAARTPTIDNFLQSALIYTNAKTPLARTFPSWVGILTGKYPLHHHARMNLADPGPILQNETLAKRLKSAGYLTIYGSDETRFTDITKAYGFDRIIGPKGGAVEFLLGGLSDLPLTNLLVNLPIGRLLFPYNYGNRAADITYQPDKYLRLVRAGLINRPHQPVFLSIHLCLTHWPFRWSDGVMNKATIPQQYDHSIEAIDAQLAGLMQILKEAGLLNHSIVVLLSDHGVTLGMRGDRLITEAKYRGNPKLMKTVSVNKLGSAATISLDFKHDYTVSASYGQGTDVLSPKQNQVLLAWRGYGVDLPQKHVNELVMLFDTAPTVLEYLHLAPMKNIDGLSLLHTTPRSLYLETGDRVMETETNDIAVDRVVQHAANAYYIDTKSGLLQLTAAAQKSGIENKQHAVIWHDWLLAKFPKEMRYKTTLQNQSSVSRIVLKPTMMPAYFVLVNLKTQEWTVGLETSFAKTAPVKELMGQLKAFYGDEV